MNSGGLPTNEGRRTVEYFHGTSTRFATARACQHMRVVTTLHREAVAMGDARLHGIVQVERINQRSPVAKLGRRSQ